MIIAPLKNFLITHKLNNPSDAGTYYVRAVITNSVTGATIDTVNLTDNGSKYFSYLWTTPGDQSGTGLQITIKKTAYDDSGYTTESVIYGTEVENYIVRDLAGIRSTFGGSGATNALGVKDIEKVLRAVLGETEKKVLDKADESKDTSILAQVSEIASRLNELEKNQSEKHTELKEIFDTKVEGLFSKVNTELGIVRNSLANAMQGLLSHAETRHSEMLNSGQEGQEASRADAEKVLAEITKLQEREKALMEYWNHWNTELKDSVESTLSRPVHITLGNSTQSAGEPAPKKAPETQRSMTVKKLLGR